MGLRRLLLPLAALIALAALAALATTGYGAGGKSVQVVVSQDAVAGRTADFTLTITNAPDQRQSVGSMNVTPPFPLVPAAPDNTVELRDLALEPGQSRTVTVRAAVPCGPVADPTWRIVAKQSNDFNGAPGNAVPVTGTLSTPVSGACALRFVGQPADARVGQTLSGMPYDPAGPAVAVEAVDGEGVRVTSFAGSVAIALSPDATPSRLSGDRQVEAVAGLAEFGDLAVAAPGVYRLGATSAGMTAVSSDAFRVDSVSVRCDEDVACSGSAPTDRSTLTVTGLPSAAADAGRLRLSFAAGLALDCTGYDEMTSGTAVFEVTGGRAKTGTLQIDKRTMNAVSNNGVSFLEICLGSPKQFIAKSGLPAEAHGTFDWNGDGIAAVTEQVYRGKLPDCGVVAPPCVSKRQKTGAGDGVIQALLPPGDPAMRG